MSRYPALVIATILLVTSNLQAFTPIKVGVMAPLYGSQHIEAEQLLRGVEIAHSMGFQGLGVPVELETVTSITGPSDAAVTALRLVSRDMCKVLIAGVSGGIASSAYYATRGLEATVVSPAANGFLVTGDRRDLSLDRFLDKEQARLAAKVTYQDLGFRKAAICVDLSQEWSIGLANEFKRQFEEMGGKVILKTRLENGWSGLGEMLNGFKNSGAQFIYAPIFSLQCAHLAIARNAMGFKGPIITIEASANSDMIKEAGPASEGIIATGDFKAGTTYTERGRRFRQTYVNAYGQDPEMWAILAAEAYFRILESLQSNDIGIEAGQVTWEFFQKRLAGTDSWTLLSPRPKTNAPKLSIVKNGKFTPNINPSSLKVKDVRISNQWSVSSPGHTGNL